MAENDEDIGAVDAPLRDTVQNIDLSAIAAIPMSTFTADPTHYVDEQSGPRVVTDRGKNSMIVIPVTEAIHERHKPVTHDLSAIKTELRLLASVKTERQRQAERNFDADSRSEMVGKPE